MTDTDRLAALLNSEIPVMPLRGENDDAWLEWYDEYAARLRDAGVRLDATCECGHPDLCTPLPAGFTIAPADGLREALRAVLRDFDRDPTEEYLDEAVRIFHAARTRRGAARSG